MDCVGAPGTARNGRKYSDTKANQSRSSLFMQMLTVLEFLMAASELVGAQPAFASLCVLLIANCAGLMYGIWHLVASGLSHLTQLMVTTAVHGAIIGAALMSPWLQSSLNTLNGHRGYVVSEMLLLILCLNTIVRDKLRGAAGPSSRPLDLLASVAILVHISRLLLFHALVVVCGTSVVVVAADDTGLFGAQQKRQSN